MGGLGHAVSAQYKSVETKWSEMSHEGKIYLVRTRKITGVCRISAIFMPQNQMSSLIWINYDLSASRLSTASFS